MLELNMEMKVINENHAVRLDEIPKKYRQLEYLGKGATTIAYKLNDTTALLFTRDDMKMQWLKDGIHMVSHHEIITPVRKHPIPGISDKSLHMITMPLLYPLSEDQMKTVVHELKDWKNTYMKNMSYRNSSFKFDAKSALKTYINTNPDSILIPFLKWITAHDTTKYIVDISAKQFKQTANGEIVLLDPVIDAEVVNLFYAAR